MIVETRDIFEGRGANLIDVTGRRNSDVDPPSQPPLPSMLPNGVAVRYHFVWSGQSYVYGDQGAPAISTTQPFDNERADEFGVLDPLIAQGGVEDLLCASANQLTFMGGPSNVIAHQRALGGSLYTQIGPGSGLYAQSVAIVNDVATVIDPDVERVAALSLQHGFTDSIDGVDVNDYMADILAWPGTLLGDTDAATGQTSTIPLFLAQISFWQIGASPITSEYPLRQLAAGLTQSNVYCVGPCYQFPIGPDNIHLTAEGYNHYAELWGKIFYLVLYRGLPWRPTYAVSATATAGSSVVRVSHFSPSAAFGLGAPGAAPLAIDTTNVTAATNFGFRYVAAPGEGVPRTISSVALGESSGAYQDVLITLSGPPRTGSAIGYADLGAQPPAAPRGNIRDQDATPRRSNGQPLYNWACASRTTITGVTEAP